jgi:hypothetical protein
MKKYCLISVLGLTGLLCVAQEQQGLPYGLCIPAVDAARSTCTNEIDQIFFIYGFRDGFLSAMIGEGLNTIFNDEQGPREKGFRAAGQYYLKLQHRRLDMSNRVTFACYGYNWIEITGKLNLAPERAHFTPLEQTKPWWIRRPKRVRENMGQDVWRNGNVLSVCGWLSPEGHYGHMGLCSRELIVSEVGEPKEHKNKPVVPTKAAQPVRTVTNQTIPTASPSR